MVNAGRERGGGGGGGKLDNLYTAEIGTHSQQVSLSIPVTQHCRYDSTLGPICPKPCALPVNLSPLGSGQAIITGLIDSTGAMPLVFYRLFSVCVLCLLKGVLCPCFTVLHYKWGPHWEDEALRGKFLLAQSLVVHSRHGDSSGLDNQV